MIGAAAPTALIERFSWFPRVALLGYTLMTIVGYLVMGPYFTLGFIAKGIEVGLVTLLVIDIIRVYGSPMGLRPQRAGVGRPDRPGALPPDRIDLDRQTKGGPVIRPAFLVAPRTAQTSLCSTAYRAAWVREASASLPRMFDTCVRAVRSVMPSS